MLSSLVATRPFLALPPLATLVPLPPPPPPRGGVNALLFPDPGTLLTSDDDMGDGDLADDNLVIVFMGVVFLLTLLFEDDDEDVSGPLIFTGDGDRRSLLPPGERERKLVARRAIIVQYCSTELSRSASRLSPLNVQLFRRFSSLGK